MRLSTCEAARRIGVSRNTLLRWFREGRVGDVHRDRNGWRLFAPEDIARIRRYADMQVPPQAVPLGSGSARA
jgi:predicted site-specific integrase-resolvase